MHLMLSPSGVFILCNQPPQVPPCFNVFYFMWSVLAFNSLRPSDAIWRQWSWTTLAQVMACCLTAPSHYLNQCWLIIRGVLWHTSESSFAGIAQGIDSGYEFEKDILKNIFKSPRGQWVNSSYHVMYCVQCMLPVHVRLYIHECIYLTFLKDYDLDIWEDVYI